MQTEKNTKNTPNISNVVEVIKSSTNVVNVVLKNIVTASSAVEKIDIKKFQENTKKFNKISSIIYTYLDVLNSVINTISKTSADKTGLDEMLQYYERIEVSQNAEGKEIKNVKTGYKIIDATSQLGILFKNIADSINNLGGLGGKENMLSFYLKTKVASKMIKSTLKDMITTIVDAITSINTDKLSKAQQLLIGDPEVVEQTNNIFRKDSKNKDGGTKSSFKDLTKITTTKARQGLLEGISTIFAIIDSVTNFSLNPLKFVLFKIKLKIIRTHIIEILGMMNKIVPGPQRKSIKSGLDFLIGDGKTPGVLGSMEDPSKGVMGLVTSLSVIVDMIKKTALIFGVKKIHDRLVRGLSNIMEYIKIVLLIIDDKSTKNLLAATSTRTNESVMSQLSQIFEQLNGLSSSLLQIAFKGIILSAMKKYIIKTVDILLNIVEKISEIFVKFNSQTDLSVIIDQIKDIKDIFVNLGKLAIAIIGFAIIATPAIIAAFLSIGFIWALMWCLKEINLVLDLFPNESIRDISRDILNFAIIFYSLIAVEMALIAISIITMKYWKEMLLGIIFIGVLLLVLAGALKMISKVVGIAVNTQTLINLAWLSLVITAMTINVLLLILLSEVAKKVEWDDLLKVLALFGATIIAILAIGALAMLIAPIATSLLPAIGIVALIVVLIAGTMLAIIGTIMVIKNQLEKIQNMELDKDDFERKLGDLTSMIDILITKITKIDFKPIKLLARITNLTLINSLLRKLKRIANNLNAISSIDLKSNNIKKKLSDIFDIVFNNPAGIVPTIVKMNDINDKRKSVRQAKRLLRQVGGVTKQIKNIVEDLNTISTFTIDESSITGSLEKIFSLINTIQTKIDDYLIPDDITRSRAQRRQMRRDRKKMRQAKQILSKSDEVIMEIADIVDSFNSIKEFKIEDGVLTTAIDNIFSKVNEFITIIDGQSIGGVVDINSKDFSNKLNVLERISNIIKGFIPDQNDAEIHKNFIDSNIKLLDKIDTIDIEKLKTASNIFEKMSNFSESINGNFDQLAETLNEKIAPLMQDLKDLLEKVPDKIDESSANISASTFAAANPNLSQSEMIAQAGREMPNADQARQAEIAQQRMMEQLRRQSNDMTSKMEELIDLFRNGVAQVRMA